MIHYKQSDEAKNPPYYKKQNTKFHQEKKVPFWIFKQAILLRSTNTIHYLRLPIKVIKFYTKCEQSFLNLQSI